MTKHDVFDTQGDLPLVSAADLDPVCRSPALGAFVARRIEQRIRFGHSPAGDLANPVDKLLREARARIDHALEWIGHNADHCPPGRIDDVLLKIELSGALLLAAHDRVSAEREIADHG